jgi:hypothetical protein
MSSNMSRRRRLEPPPEPPDPEPEVPDPDPVPPELDVEYFADAEELDSVRTSVPNSLQSSHSWSSAPSTFTVVRDGCSLPHISH